MTITMDTNTLPTTTPQPSVLCRPNSTRTTLTAEPRGCALTGGDCPSDLAKTATCPGC